jgi:two-component system sensor histidine kinase YesM
MRWMRFVRQIRFKIFLFNSIVMLIAVFSLGFTAYHYMFDVLTQKENDSISSLSKNSRDYVKQYMFHLQSMLTNLSGQFAVKQSPEEIRALLDQYHMILNPIVSDLYYRRGNEIYSLDENSRAYGRRNTSVSRIFQFAEEHNLPMFTTGPVVRDGQGPVLTLSIRSHLTADTDTILSADLYLPILNEALASINSSHNISMILFGDNGKPAASDIKPQTVEYERLYDEIKQHLSTSLSDTLFFDALDGRYIVFTEPVGFFDWQIVFFSPKDQLSDPTNKLNSYTLAFALLFTLVLFLASMVLSGYINRPIQLMIRQMNRVNLDNMRSRVILRSNDEFSFLAETYNRMIERIDYLIRENERIESLRKSFQIRALQAQIHPHFLYNTLNSINSLIDLGRIHEVPDLLDALVELLEYTADQKSEFVSLREEFQALQDYVNIQKIRYGSKFEVRFKIEHNTLDCKVLKMTLQPIVENAIFHGMKGKKGAGLIEVGAYRESGSLLIYIEDNGGGIAQSIKDRLLYDEARSHYGESRGGSIGLKNVHDRIRLYYGDQFGIEISSEPSCGTKVIICMPCDELGDKEDVTNHEGAYR